MERITDTESLTSRETTPYNEPNTSGSNSTLDNIKNTVADKLHAAAGAIKEKAANTGASEYAQKASDWLGGAARYVRDLDPQQVKRDIQGQVRSNPGRALLIAGAAGLVLGALFRRR